MFQVNVRYVLPRKSFHGALTDPCFLTSPVSLAQSNFACVVCDLKWEDHETLFETTQERSASGRTVGERPWLS